MSTAPVRDDGRAAGSTGDTGGGSEGGGSSRVPPSLGPHGEGWVAIQVVVLSLMLLAGLRGPRWPRAGRTFRVLAGVPLGATGVALLLAGATRIGRHLTPLPRPTEENELRRDGAFGLVRHPIYGGVLLAATAWGLLTSPCALATVAPAVPFVELKRRREEAWLAERHPDYAEYAADVPHKFVPYVW